VGELPPALTVMAEYHAGPLWARPYGSAETVDPSRLGLPTTLVEALNRWNDVYGRLARTDFVWQEPPSEQEWTNEGAWLAVELQQALPDVEVWYWDNGTQTRAYETPRS
jgi:hypothetical protein